MASSENLASLDPWAFRPTFPDSWISEAYARDADALTKALQKSLYDTVSNLPTISDPIIKPFEAAAPQTPTASNITAGSSDPETAPLKRHRSGNPAPTGKVSKRKSRASKRSQTTFITADPANFREMVQQVTGVRFGDSQAPLVTILKPEPQRLGGGRLQESGGGGCLPTLDTSAFLLDNNQQQVVMGLNSGSNAGPSIGQDPISFSQPMGADGGGGGGGGVGLDFDVFSIFPTLESWKVLGQ